MAFSPRVAAAASLLAVLSLLGACDGLIKKTPDACSVTVAPIDVTVPVNGSTGVVGTAFDCDGNSILKRPVTFSSANPLIASVTTAGVIIGVAPGVTTVVASASGKTADVKVTVSPERVSTVSVTPASVTLRKTNTRLFTAVSKNASGTVINGVTLTWASSNSSIASVDNNGNVTALAVGLVNITATADGQTGTSNVTVTEVPIGSCSLTPGTQDILVNKQGTIAIAIRDTANPSNPLTINGRGFNWSSDNEVVATVVGSTSSATVTGKKAGTVKITATSTEPAAISCNSTAVIKDPVIKTVQITPISQVLRVGAPRQYTVTLFDVDGLVIPNTGRTITWTNPTPTFAVVSSSGLVTPTQVTPAGTFGKIAVDAEGIKDTATFTITKIPVVTITVAPLSSTIQVAQTKQFVATVTDSAGNIVTDRTIEWISSDNNKATVNSSGLATGVGAGSTSISANSEGRSGAATLNVTAAAVDTIQVVSTTFSLAKATSSPFAITLRDASGNQLRNRTVVVTSDQPSIATGVADASSTTVNVTGVAIGTATLTIQALDANNNNQGKASKVVVTVTP